MPFHHKKQPGKAQPEAFGLALGEPTLSTSAPKNGVEALSGISQIIVVILGILGTAYCFLSMFQIPHYPAVLIFCTILFTVLFYSILSNKTACKIGIPLLAFLLLLAFYLFRSRLVDGFVVTANYIVWRINARMGWSLYDYVSHCPRSLHELVITILLLVILFVFAFFLCLAVTRRQSLLAVLLLTLPPLIVGLYFWLSPSYVPLVMLVTCWVAVVAMRLMLPKHSHKIKKNGAFLWICKKKPRLELNVSRVTRAVSLRVTAILICVTLLSSGLLALIFPKVNYQHPDSVTQLREDLTAFFNGLTTQQVFNNGVAGGGISEGKLGNVGKLSFQELPALTVHMEHPSQQYLRGWIGGEYTGHSWTPLPDAVYQEHQAVFQELDQRQFYPQMQQGSYWNMVTSCYVPDMSLISSYTPTVLHSSMDVMVENANKKYIYTPYTLLTHPKNGSPAYDGAYYADGWLGQEQYTLDTYQDISRSLHYSGTGAIPMPFAYSDIDQEFGFPVSAYFNSIDTTMPLAKNYIQGEEAYRSFVHEVYTQLPKESRAAAERFISENQMGQWLDYEYVANSIQSIESITSYLTSMLGDHAIYTIAPGQTPSDRDFVEYFLFENQKGYCTHFATAAAVLFRALGIPARYAEGYVLTQENIEEAMRKQNAAEGEALTVTINDTNAHAWVEIYMDGYGWIPIEATPGYAGLGSINLSGQDTPEPSAPAVSSRTPSSSSAVSSSSSSTSSRSNPNTSSSSSHPSSYEDKSSVWGSLLFIFGIVLLVLLLILVILVLRRRWTLNKRHQAFSGPPNDAAIACYQYLVRLFAFDGLQDHRNSLLEYANQVEARYSFIPKGQFSELIRLIQKAKFSQHALTETEVGRLTDFAGYCAAQLYEGYSLWKRLTFKYVHTLY